MSAPTIGFLILSHEGDGKLRRLVAALNQQYDNPPIAIHHNFSLAAQDVGTFPPNVRFVRPHRRTGWGKWTTVQAVLDALALLYRDQDPDWFFLLSAADYPVMAADKVREELASTDCDAFIDVRPVTDGTAARARLIGEPNPGLDHFQSAGNRELKRRWYLSAQLWLPTIRWKPQPRLGRVTYRPPVRGLHPFTPEFGCFCGEGWVTGNRKVAQIRLSPSRQDLKLRRFLRMRPLPEEAYYATVLANRADVTIQRDNRRYTDWGGGGAHPRLMTIEGLPAVFASGAFFARKFSDAPGIREAVDQRLSAANAVPLPASIGS